MENTTLQSSSSGSKSFFGSLSTKTKLNLQTWLTIVIIVSTLSIILLIAFILDSASEQRLTEFANSQLEQANETVVTRVNDWLDQNLSMLHQVASFDQINGMQPDQQQSILEKTAKKYPDLFLLHTLDMKGMNVARSDEGKLISYAERAWFTGITAEQDPTWQVLNSKTTGKPSLAMAVPIRTADGQTVGVLGLSGNLRVLSDALLLGETTSSTGEAMTTFVVDLTVKESPVIAHRDATISDNLTDYSTKPPVVAMREGKRGIYSYRDDQGKEWISYLSKLENGWGVITQQPQTVAMASTTSLRITTLLVSLAASVVLVLIAYFISRQISKPIIEMTGKAQAIAAGDLNQTVQLKRSDELGALANAFNQMTGQLRIMLDNERTQREYLQNTVTTYLAHLRQVTGGNLAVRLPIQANGHGDQDPMLLLAQSLNEMTASQQQIVAQIHTTAASLSSAAAEILAASVQQASGATEQAAAISQTTTTVDEVKAIAEQSSMRAAEVTESSQRTVQVSQQGRQAVNDTIESMSQIKQRVSGIAENTLALAEQMQQISEITASVSSLASQSNMLALNASVEAARAGEHGRGFAVVAGEVRALAEQSRQATQQIKSILSEIQKATNATVMATEEGAKGVDMGISMATQAQQSIENLSKAIVEASQTAQQLAVGGQQQVTGVNQVAIAMQSIQTATFHAQTAAKQTERAAQDLNALSHQLQEIVGRYKLA